MNAVSRLNESRAFTRLLSGCVLLALSACASSPATKFYSLRSLPDASFEVQLGKGVDSLGVGPVTLPSELERPNVVTELDDGRIKVASYHIWAGDLDENFTRVMAAVLSSHTGIDRVQAQPWDTRFRPKYQLRLDVLKFGGVLGKEVQLDVLWTLTANAGRDLLHSQRSRLSKHIEGHDYADYVTALSLLLSEFSKQPAQMLESVSQPSVASEAANS